MLGHLAQGSTSRVSPNHPTWKGHFNGMVVWQIDENVRGPNVLYVCLEFRPMPTSTRITCWVKRKRSESGMSICPGSAYQVDPELMFQPGSGMFGFQKHFAIASISVSLCFPLSLSSNLRVDACRVGTRTRHLGESSHVQPCPAMFSLHLIAHGDLVALLCHKCHECHECPGAPGALLPRSTDVDTGHPKW